MTISKSIRNVQNALDGTVNSAVKAATELAKVPSILRKFELSGVENKATIQDGDDAALENYVIQLENLDEKSKSAASSLVLLNDAQKQDAAGIANRLQSGERLNSQLAQRTLATTSLSEMQQRQIMTESSLIDSSGNYRAELVQQAEANVMNSSTFKALTSSEQMEVIAAIEATAAKQGQTAATVTLTAAQKALNATMLIGKQILLGIGVAVLTAAVTALVKKIAESIPTYENLKNKTAEAAQAFTDAKQKVTDLESKLDDINQKMRECKDSDTGKIVDPESLELLESQRSLLMTNLRLAKQNREEAAKDANKAVYNQFNGGEYNVDTGERENIAETVQRKIESYKDWQKQIDDTTASLQKEGASEQVISDKTALATQMRDDAMATIREYSGDLTELSDQLIQNGDDGTQAYKDTSKAIADAGNAVAAFIDYYDNGISYTTQAVNEFNNSVADGYEKAKLLADAIASGDVESGSEAYEYAAELAERYGISVETLINRLEELHDAQQNVDSDEPSWDVDTTQELADFMSKLSDSSSDLYAKTKALTSAYNDMYTSQKLSSDSIQSLISAYPDLISQMETENGVTTISKDLLSDKFEAMKGAMVTTIQSEIQATEAAITEAENRISTYQHEIKIITALYSAIGGISFVSSSVNMGHGKSIGLSDEQIEAVKAYDTNYKELTQTITDAKAKLADQKKTLDVLNNLTLPNYAGATKGASSANKGATKAAKENKKALEAQKKEAEKTKKSLENYSKTLKAQGDAVIKVLDKRKDALEKDKKERDKAWGKQKEQLEEEKKLQDEVYDKQKEALQDKKKALQDANDEEDRAIKLAQLQDALEKARTQRTKRVYEHDTGFEWKVDDSAVSDAQNNLDDQQRTWKREDAIDAVEKEIEAIEKLKDAYDDEVEAAIDAIEKQKDAYDDSIDAQIDKIEEMKDKYQEVLDLIGMSWEEYQAMLDATALAEGMSLDAMGENLVGFKENVIQNMKEIAAAEAEVQRLTDAISGIDTSSSESGGGGGGGGGGGFGNLANAAYQATEKLSGLTEQMKEQIVKIETLKARERDLNEQITTGNITHSERVKAMCELKSVQGQIEEGEATLTDLSAQYVIALGEETNATDEYRTASLNNLQMLVDGYNIDYENIFSTLQKHLQDVQDTNTGTAGVYDSMSQTVDLFAQNVTGSLDGMGEGFDTLVQKIQKAAKEIENTCKKATENIKKMNLEAKNAASGEGSNAIGSRNIRKSGYYHVDESGPEIVVHDGKPSSGRYTYLERGDQVLPASYSKNLWDMGSNPSEWFERQYSKFNRMDNTKVAYAGNSTVYSPSFTGDIVISNPVANSDDLARGLTQNLPASFMQAIGVRM